MFKSHLPHNNNITRYNCCRYIAYSDDGTQTNKNVFSHSWNPPFPPTPYIPRRKKDF